MPLAAALVYWVIVAIWATVMVAVAVFFVRNPQAFGATRLLLAVVAIDTFRNIFENVYFGLYFGGQYGLFPADVVALLGQPALLIVPKLLNVVAGCAVLGLMLFRWLPLAVRERGLAEERVGQLETLATIDSLTGVYNRRHFESLARMELSRFHRYQRPLSLLLLDIDHFKSVNDRFGHATGDKVITAVADVCRATKRESDVMARIGGEEFVVLLPETTIESAQVVAERLRQLVSTFPFVAGGEELSITVSIGAAAATLGMSGIGALLQRADEALYAAKNSGRNRVCLARVDSNVAPLAQAAE